MKCKYRMHPGFSTFDLETCFSPQWGTHFFDIWTTAGRPKVVRTPGLLDMFTSKCASRNNSGHFFDISTSKSAPALRCFLHLGLKMCFAPGRRALFQHLNFQKPSDRDSFRHVLLPNVLRATMAYTFRHLDDSWTPKSGPNP